MNFGWWDLIRIAVIATGTFAFGAFIKPIFLAARDYCVWSCIDLYIKKTNFTRRARQLAKFKAVYNKINLHPLNFDGTKNPEAFWYGDKSIKEEEFKNIVERSSSLRNRIISLSRRIDKEVSIIGSALKHYKQDETNPAIAIIQHYEEREYKMAGLKYKK